VARTVDGNTYWLLLVVVIFHALTLAARSWTDIEQSPKNNLICFWEKAGRSTGTAGELRRLLAVAMAVPGTCAGVNFLGTDLPRLQFSKQWAPMATVGAATGIFQPSDQNATS
jgi:hypothetical protein